ncbi:lysylphosphatidylglycerol synthase transmembrane domain-containing protein [Streptomyces sp. SP18BB07]|uniref:lysylphosphatidylglycerol synthase transmembrane domain-containing protein n=1 Tax=Streptomyces sp. SP18BB07 TaxID=3002522 RepID=UPI002E795C40|nr:YbhN family protein [Streptomyces sp. SP18BB07]MEE1764571.1 YbhN family protein [Streptomyces sp. SP18BB07]
MFPLPLDAPPPSGPTPPPVPDPLTLIPSPARPVDLTRVSSHATPTADDRAVPTNPENPTNATAPTAPSCDPTCDPSPAQPTGLVALLPRRVRALLPARTAANGRRLRLALALLPLVLLGAWAAFDWRTVHGGAVRLASADLRWLLAGVFFTALCSVASACVRQGAVPERLPPGQLLATQFAAGAAGHALPGNIGAHAVVLRFLRRRGIPLARATSSLALYSAVKPVAKTLVIVAFVVAFPGTLRLTELLPKGETLALVGAITGVSLAAVVTLITTVRPLRRPLIGGLRSALTDTRIVHSRPVRALALWGGAAAFPLCQGAVLASVGSSLGLPVSWPQMLFAYLVASTAAGAVPAPGGLGPMDAALVFTLVAFGAPATLATTTVIGYRVLTVWLPLLPGTLVLSALVRAKVL